MNRPLPLPTTDSMVNLWISAWSDPGFPALDAALRSGRHVSSDQVEAFLFISKHLELLSHFYERYGIELIRAPEQFYYLRPKASSLLPRSLLPPFEVLIGKTLCLLHITPEKLQKESRFTWQDVWEKLVMLLPQPKLLKFLHPRAGGSAWDQTKLQERLRLALFRLKKIGMISAALTGSEGGEEGLKSFYIQDAIFRFAADVKEGITLEDRQKSLIAEGELVGDRRIEEATEEVEVDG